MLAQLSKMIVKTMFFYKIPVLPKFTAEFPWRILSPINDNTHHSLTRSGTHDSRLILVNIKTFFTDSSLYKIDNSKRKFIS